MNEKELILRLRVKQNFYVNPKDPMLILWWDYFKEVKAEKVVYVAILLDVVIQFKENKKIFPMVAMTEEELRQLYNATSLTLDDYEKVIHA